MRAPTAAALAASIVLIVTGCGEGAGRSEATVDGIVQTLEELEEALSERDAGRICDEIFSPEARRRAGGEECGRRLGRTARELDDPSLELVSVILERDGAVARVRAASGDGPAAIDLMRFVPIEGAYRVDSFSSG